MTGLITDLAPATDRFWAKVSVAENGCWIWTGYIDKGGYGKFYFKDRMRLAHRASYEMHVAPIPEGLTLDHLCRNTRCVNPKHLEAVTHRENILRGDGRSARNARKTHCIRGHEFTPENTVWWKNRKRGCRKCRHAARRVRWAVLGT